MWILLSIWHLFVGHDYKADREYEGWTTIGTFNYDCSCGAHYSEFVM